MGDNHFPNSDPTVSTGSDKKLRGFARPIVAVDIALLSPDLDERTLLVAQMWREDTHTWALPGAFLRKGETLADAVKRCLLDKLGVEGIRQRQLAVLDDPDRDDRDWVLSVAHVAAVRPDRLDTLGSGSAARVRMVPAVRPGELAWDHAQIVRLAREDIRRRYETGADPDHLLGREFTMPQLLEVHEAVAGHHLDRDAFRRLMKDHVERTGDFQDTGGRGRPAEWLRRKR